MAQPASIFELEARRIDGSTHRLADYQGKVLLIVNTASECGFTPQYKGLESLWQKYKDQGLMVLGFPCNQFGGQEPSGNQEIANFCEKNFGVSFPLYSKIDVNGPSADPVFKYLTSRAKGVLGSGAIKWNFTKFLVSPDGKKIQRFAPTTPPEKLDDKIRKLIHSCG